MRRRLLAMRAGLIADEEEETRIREHLAGCAACLDLDKRMQEVGLAEDEDPADPHIPVRVLARWERAAAELRGIEREVVGEHLDRCEACREDLVSIGHAPSLPPVVEPAGPAGEERAGAPRWVAYWAGLATAAVLLLLLRPVLFPSPETGSGIAPTVVLTTPRGEASNVVQLPGEDVRMIVLGIPALGGLPPEAEVRFEMRSSEGRLIVAGSFRAGDLAPRSGLVLRSPGGPWDPGRYSLELHPRIDGAEALSYSIEIRAGR